MDWDKLKIFHTVAEAGSFTKASTVLNLSQSAISRQIQSLEKIITTIVQSIHSKIFWMEKIINLRLMIF